MKSVLASTLVCLTLLEATMTARAADSADAKGAVRLIEAHAKTITTVAHPTADYSRVEMDGVKWMSDGFVVTGTFHWTKSNGDAHWTTLAFHFDDDGNLEAIVPKGRSNFLPPFTSSDLAIAAVRRLLQENPRVAENPKLARFIAEADAKQLLTLHLLLKQH